MKIARLPSQKKNNVVLWILALGLPVLIYASYQVVQLITRAGADSQPKQVVLSNLTTSSATISWVTEAPIKGSVIPILNGNEKSPVIDKRGNTNRYTHYTEITSLEPNTKYDFVIVSGDEKYSSLEDITMSFKTAPISSGAPTPNPIHGSISGNSGDDVIIYAMLKDKSVYPVSTVIPSGGNWITDLSAFRKISDKSLVISGNSTNIVVVATAGIDKGAISNGAYSEMFDSNGKLKSTKELNISSNATLYTYFANETMFKEAQAIAQDPVVTPPVEEETNTDSRFRIVKDLDWIDMVSGDSVSATTGDSSVQITNLTDTGFTVLWVSAQKESGIINYGTSSSDLSNEALDERDGATNRGTYYVHSVSLSRVQPETKYYFKIKSGNTQYSTTYSATTFATLSSPPAFESITGGVSNLPSNGEGVVVAYIKDKDSTGTAGNSNKISTLVDENGKWILSIADSRKLDGSIYYEYTSADELNFSLVSTVNTTVVTQTIANAKNTDVTIAAGSGSTTGEVDLLKDYGVLGISDKPAVSSPSVLGAQSTPKTGIFDSTVGIIVVSLSVLIFSIFGILSVPKKKKRNNMKDII